MNALVSRIWCANETISVVGFVIFIFMQLPKNPTDSISLSGDLCGCGRGVRRWK